MTGAVMGAAILVRRRFAVTDTVKEEDWRWVDAVLSPTSRRPVTSIASPARTPSPTGAFVRHKDGAIIAIWNRCAHSVPHQLLGG